VEELEEWYEPLIEGLRRDSPGIQFQYVVYCMRRTILVYTAFFLNFFPLAQVALNIKISLLAFVYQASFSPYEDEKSDKVEVFNEAIIYLTSMTLLILVKESEDIEFVDQIGWVIIGLLSVYLGYHMFAFMGVIVDAAKHSY